MFKGFDYDFAKPYLCIPFFSLPLLMEISELKLFSMLKLRIGRCVRVHSRLIFYSGPLLSLLCTLLCPFKTFLNFYEINICLFLKIAICPKVIVMDFLNKKREGLQKVDYPNFEILCVKMPLNMFYCAI